MGIDSQTLPEGNGTAMRFSLQVRFALMYPRRTCPDAIMWAFSEGLISAEKGHRVAAMPSLSIAS